MGGLALRGGGGASEVGGLTLLLDKCSLKDFGTGNFFWPTLLVLSRWLLLIPGALCMVVVNSCCSLDGCC